jgi:uncharacterized protein YcnI
MLRKTLLLVLVGMAALFMVPGAAGAHVEVTADGDVGDDDVLLTSVFAENECTGAMASLELLFPSDPALTVALPQELAGWTAEVARIAGSETVEKVTWTNADGVDADGEFPLAVGLIPTSGEGIDFKAVQTCADGEVLRWVQEGANADYPAPVLTLSHAGHQDHAAADSDAETASTDSESDDSSTGLIIGGIVAAVAIIGGGAYFLLRRKGTAAE